MTVDDLIGIGTWGLIGVMAGLFVIAAIGGGKLPPWWMR